MNLVLRQKDLEVFAKKQGKSPEEIDQKNIPAFQNWPLKPEGVVGASICSLSGKAPGDSGCQTRFEYFLEGTVPTEVENLKQTVLIDKDTGQPVPPGEEQPPNVEFQEHQIVSDFLATFFCLDCPLLIGPDGQPLRAKPAIIDVQNLPASLPAEASPEEETNL